MIDHPILRFKMPVTLPEDQVTLVNRTDKEREFMIRNLSSNR